MGRPRQRKSDYSAASRITSGNLNVKPIMRQQIRSELVKEIFAVLRTLGYQATVEVLADSIKMLTARGNLDRDYSEENE